MKKNLVLMISAIVVALGGLLSSCNPTPSGNITLKTEVDSLSYSYGAAMSTQLDGYMKQMGLVVDTFSISMGYASQINGAQDDAEKAKLTNEMRHKIDSITRANEHNIAEFLVGFQKGLNARPSQKYQDVGYMIGSNVKQQDMPQLMKEFYGDDTKELNANAVTAAVAVTLKKGTHKMEDPTMYIRMKSEQKRMAKGSTNKVAGEKFLEENKSKDGVVTLPSGVQYKILKEGTGNKPSATDQVLCHYHGTLLDGTVFDSSVTRGEPASFGVHQVIPGWTELLQLMPVGSKWEVYIPYDKAYGEMGSGGGIEPFSTLIFQIELLEIL